MDDTRHSSTRIRHNIRTPCETIDIRIRKPNTMKIIFKLKRSHHRHGKYVSLNTTDCRSQMQYDQKKNNRITSCRTKLQVVLSRKWRTNVQQKFCYFEKLQINDLKKKVEGKKRVQSTTRESCEWFSTIKLWVRVQELTCTSTQRERRGACKLKHEWFAR